METDHVPDSESINKSCTVPSSSSNNNTNDGNFECNICFEVADEDPIVTLCGHLYCWPCLYKWLHMHSHSHECPVCKALIEEDKLVPLYGRGTTHSDPRSRSSPGVEIPRRPTGQRPETVPTYHTGRIPLRDVMSMPMDTSLVLINMVAIVFRVVLPAFIPISLSLQMHRFSDATGYETVASFHHGGINSSHSGLHRAPNQPLDHEQSSYNSLLLYALKITLIFLGFAVVFFLIRLSF
ncbi:zf-C3HC4_2 domain-containing protein [Cephalotus follicularis]|uniref:E3 ubiquitin-protein ligase RMA n=1 Tax=Cephalotus follicularis TaxID=3775 RepID=A0A1Q3BGT2_CEPFO|nr:zf-C3HC4_2 domain-containing protein [Cephalotus follicularis]